MKTHKPKVISDSNLSVAWARAFLHVFDCHDPGCLLITIRDFDAALPSEDPVIAEALDAHLETMDDIPTIHQTALTIVPYERWFRTNCQPIEELSKWYLKLYLPRLKARSSKNQHGTYFERLTAFSGVKMVKGNPQYHTINQIQFVIDLWRDSAQKGKRPRQSALQLSCFDPAKDHTGSALAGFPCLQQVSLTYKEKGSLELNAYYPTQYILDRAYGNYLGLCQLGHLIAHHLNVKLTRFTCFIGNPELGTTTKSEVSKLEHFLRRRLAELRPEGFEHE